MKKIPSDKKAAAVELLRAGKTYREVAEALDISIGSVHNIANEPPEVTAPFVDEIKKRLAHKHYILADHILNNLIISPYSIGKASLKDRVLAAAILLDKARQIEGVRTPLPQGEGRGEGGVSSEQHLNTGEHDENH